MICRSGGWTTWRGGLRLCASVSPAGSTAVRRSSRRPGYVAAWSGHAVSSRLIPPPQASAPDAGDPWLARFARALPPSAVAAAPSLLAMPRPELLLRSDGGGVHDEAALEVLQALIEAVAPGRGLIARTVRAAAASHQASPPTASSAPTPQRHALAPAAVSVPLGYEGAALASGDFDDDGKVDLAVGAYGVGQPGAPQQGRLEVVYAVNASGVGARRTAVVGGIGSHRRFGAAACALDFDLGAHPVSPPRPSPRLTPCQMVWMTLRWRRQPTRGTASCQ